MDNAQTITVQICCITPQQQFKQELILPIGSTIQQAILQSDLSKSCPQIDWQQLKIGIYSKIKSVDTVLKNADRIEIYRPLQVDPMLARRKRAIKKGNL